MINKLRIILFLFCLQIPVFAQQTGTPFITNYPPDAYKSSSQNWAIAQDKRGVMFFGNSNAVLEYDGVTWRYIPMQNTVRSLAIDDSGSIFVGGNGDFGYLHPDSLGTYQYRSLKEKIPVKHHDFNDVWNIFVLGKQVFFQTFEKIFIYENKKIKVLSPENSFHLSFMVNHSFYVREAGKGLMIYKNDSLQLLEGGERFADEKIYAMLPYGQSEILIATRTQGILVYSPIHSQIYKPVGFEAVDNFLIQNMSYCGHELENGCYAIGTLAGGIIVFNSAGKIQTIYNTGSGLQDNSIRKLYQDNNRQLWAALNNGISLVQNNLPFQFFNEKNGLKGFPMCIYYFKNRLYVGTSEYLCVQNPDGTFETIPGTEGQNWQLYNANGTLLLAALKGLFEIKEKKAIPLANDYGFINFCPLNNKPGFLLSGIEAAKGLCLLEYHQKTWKLKNVIKGFAKFAYTVVQDKDGDVWVHTNPGLFRLKLNENMDSAISVMQYTTEHGLPPDYAVPCLLNSGELVFVTTKGIYRYNSTSGNFIKHPAFNMLAGTIYPFQQQKNGDIWFQEVMGNGIYEKGVLKYNNGKYQLYKQAFYKFNEYLNSHDHNFYSASDSVMFIGTVKGLLQYNPLQKVNYNIPFHTLIRKVIAKDSLVFGGATAEANDFEHIKGCDLPYRQNNLVFHYAAAFYEDVEKNLYSYRLLGSDTAWSAWVSDVKKEYTNLPEGRYTFEVKAKNQYKVVGKTAMYSFHILPPIYRTWWAFLIYGVLAIAFIFLIVEYNSTRLKRDKLKLEKIIEQRTFEIQNQKEEILDQKNQLEVANATKDKFFSILAHDLRGPFNSLLGFSELLVMEIQKGNQEKYSKYAGIIRQSVNDVFNLLENLLTWSRSQSKNITFNPQKSDLSLLVENCIKLLTNPANSKGITLKSNVPVNTWVNADEDMALTILRNLITNAIKFSRKGDLITVDAQPKDDWVTILVADTGVGMEQEVMSRLFMVGESIKTQGTAKEQGTGLGLLLCKEFVEYHQGKIWVESQLEVGSTFYFTLPLSKI